MQVLSSNLSSAPTVPVADAASNPAALETTLGLDFGCLLQGLTESEQPTDQDQDSSSGNEADGQALPLLLLAMLFGQPAAQVTSPAAQVTSPAAVEASAGGAETPTRAQSATQQFTAPIDLTGWQPDPPQPDSLQGRPDWQSAIDEGAKQALSGAQVESESPTMDISFSQTQGFLPTGDGVAMSVPESKPPAGSVVPAAEPLKPLAASPEELVAVPLEQATPSVKLQGENSENLQSTVQGSNRQSAVGTGAKESNASVIRVMPWIVKLVQPREPTAKSPSLSAQGSASKAGSAGDVFPPARITLMPRLATGSTERLLHPPVTRKGAKEPEPLTSDVAVQDKNATAEGNQSPQRLPVFLIKAQSDLGLTPSKTEVINLVAKASAEPFEQLQEALQTGVRQLQVTARDSDGITIKMQLYPKDLGEVRVDIKLIGNAITARFEAVRPEAAQIIKENLPNLKSMLDGQGFSQVTLDAESFGSGFGQTSDRRFSRPPSQGNRESDLAKRLVPDFGEAISSSSSSALSRVDYRM